MRFPMKAALPLSTCGLLASMCAANGRIVLAHDEWTLSNTGFTNAPSAGQFVRNVADFFTGGGPGNFLAWSNNFGLNQSTLNQTMVNAGHTWTVSLAGSQTLATLLPYDAVFLVGSVFDNAVLTQYVQAGGCVYLAGGTGTGNATVWDDFLHAFGLDMGDLNGLSATQTITSPHAIFQGVTSLYHANGNDVSDLNPLSSSNQVLQFSGLHGLYAVYDPTLETSTFCFGDGSLPTPCPCALPDIVPNPSGSPGSGCANSQNPHGALLGVSGSTAPDTVTFTAFVSPVYVAYALLLKGDAEAPGGIGSSDGLRCVDGQLVRFGAHYAATNGASQGYWTYPNSVQTTPVSIQTAQAPGQTAHYQLFYRNAAPNFCNASTANWSNAIRILWP